MVEAQEDWRTNGDVALALATVEGDDVHNLGRPPVMVMDGKVYDYPGAMRVLRGGVTVGRPELPAPQREEG